MRIYLLPILTLLLFNNQIFAAAAIYAYDEDLSYPCAFTIGVIAGATTAPVAILSLQALGIDPITSYCCILAGASSSAYLAEIPYNILRTFEATRAAANWNLLQANYKNGTKIQLLPTSPDKLRRESYELLQVQSFAQGFLTGAALAPLMLYLKMPYVMMHTS